MDLSLQALIMGLIQGLTEFIPVSSSGHLVVVPYLFHWTDPFITSTAFTVMLHMGTLVALLVYFWRDWVVLIPAGLATIRDRSFRGDQNRRLAWLIVVTTIPAILLGPLLNDTLEAAVREPGPVAIMLCVGAAILWLAERWGSKARDMLSLRFPEAFGIGCAQALALVPGISRSGISISAGLFLGLNREAAARFSFLMSAPVIAGAGAFEARKIISGADTELNIMLIGFVTALVAGFAAIHFMLEFLRRQPVTLFVVYRVVLAIVVFLALLGLPHGI